MHLNNGIGKAVTDYTPDVFWKTYSVSNLTTPKLIFFPTKENISGQEKEINGQSWD